MSSILRQGRLSRTRGIVAVAAALGLALGTAMPAAAATAPDAWTGPFGGPGNTSTDLGETSLTASRAAAVKQVWHAAAGNSGLSAEAPVVLNGVAYWVRGTDRLVATSPTDGSTRWTLHLTGGQDYSYGLAAAGNRLVIAFRGATTPSGVTAVDVSKRKVLWRALLPNEKSDPRTPAYPGLPYTDGTRVYLSGGDYAVNTYRLTDGKALWRQPFRGNSNGTIAAVDGIAAGGGILYTSGQQGLIARRGSTGRQLWRSTVATSGRPVLTGSRIAVATASGLGVESFTAKGCAAATCAPKWDDEYLDPTPAYGATVAAADANEVYVTYTSESGVTSRCTSGWVGHVTRLSASTGATEWSTTAGTSALGLIHGADTLWLYEGGIRPDCVQTNLLTALPATGTSTAPIAQIDLGPTSGFPQTLSIAGGTLFRQDRLDPLAGYRVIR